MNFIQKKTRSIFIFLLVCMVLYGCTSYSLRGVHSNYDVTKDEPNNQKYRLDIYETKFPRYKYPWSISNGAGSEITKEEVSDELIKKYPFIFSNQEDAIPIKVVVENTYKKMHKKTMLSGFFMVIVTVGLYPAHMIKYEDKCSVAVTILDKSNKEKTGLIQSRSNVWLSVYTPFAFFKTDKPDEYTSSHERGIGILETPVNSIEIVDKQKKVFITELVDEIAVCIKKLDYKKI